MFHKLQKPGPCLHGRVGALKHLHHTNALFFPLQRGQHQDVVGRQFGIGIRSSDNAGTPVGQDVGQEPLVQGVGVGVVMVTGLAEPTIAHEIQSVLAVAHPDDAGPCPHGPDKSFQELFEKTLRRNVRLRELFNLSRQLNDSVADVLNAFGTCHES